MEPAGGLISLQRLLQQSGHTDDLPPLVLQQIIDCLPPKDIVSTALVCKTGNKSVRAACKINIQKLLALAKKDNNDCCKAYEIMLEQHEEPTATMHSTSGSIQKLLERTKFWKHLATTGKQMTTSWGQAILEEQTTMNRLSYDTDSEDPYIYTPEEQLQRKIGLGGIHSTQVIPDECKTKMEVFIPQNNDVSVDILLRRTRQPSGEAYIWQQDNSNWRYVNTTNAEDYPDSNLMHMRWQITAHHDEVWHNLSIIHGNDETTQRSIVARRHQGIDLDYTLTCEHVPNVENGTARHHITLESKALKFSRTFTYGQPTGGYIWSTELTAMIYNREGGHVLVKADKEN